MPHKPRTHTQDLRRRGRTPRPRDTRQSAYRRGYGGKAWERLRTACFVRDAYTCQRCKRVCQPGSANRRDWPHAHHVIDRVDGGADELDNLRTLCQSCHSIVTLEERRA